MSPFLPGLNWRTLSSETGRYETKRRRRAVSEPTPMDVDGEEGSQFRCSFCNGNRISYRSQGPDPVIDAFDIKDIVSRSHPDTSPIYFYDRGKPFFECACTYNLMFAGCVILLMPLCLDLRTFLCTRLNMTERSTLPPNIVRSEATSCGCNDDRLSSLSSIQVHDH
jgi:hypothetical protein